MTSEIEVFKNTVHKNLNTIIDLFEKKDIDNQIKNTKELFTYITDNFTLVEQVSTVFYEIVFNKCEEMIMYVYSEKYSNYQNYQEFVSSLYNLYKHFPNAKFSNLLILFKAMNQEYFSNDTDKNQDLINSTIKEIVEPSEITYNVNYYSESEIYDDIEDDEDY